jgi:regulatory protein YycI of two-component signal transduction system YycFG
MKKRSNITLVIILLLLISIPFAAYAYFRKLVNEAEKNPANKGLKEIRLQTRDKDSIQISLEGNDVKGISVKTHVVKHSK